MIARMRHEVAPKLKSDSDNISQESIANETLPDIRFGMMQYRVRFGDGGKI